MEFPSADGQLQASHQAPAVIDGDSVDRLLAVYAPGYGWRVCQVKKLHRGKRDFKLKMLGYNEGCPMPLWPYIWQFQ
jgi:hypothetical protein